MAGISGMPAHTSVHERVLANEMDAEQGLVVKAHSRGPARSPVRIGRLASSGSLTNLVSEVENNHGEWKIDEGDIDMSTASIIGEGASGQIFRARNKGADVAVKLLRREVEEVELRAFSHGPSPPFVF